MLGYKPKISFKLGKKKKEGGIIDAHSQQKNLPEAGTSGVNVVSGRSAAVSYHFVWTRSVYLQLLAFSIIYGFFLINFVDYDEIISPHVRSVYHIWLMVMYFAPFALIRIFIRGERRYFLGFGLLVSLMNDGLWWLWLIFMDAGASRIDYVLSNWWTFSPNEIFALALGFAYVPVYGWSMSFSLYARIVAVCYLLNPRRLRILRESLLNYGR